MKVKKYYATGNTAAGFVDYLPSNLHDMKEIIELERASYEQHTWIIKRLIERYENETTIEVICSPVSTRYLDGIIFRDKKIAVLAPIEQPFTNKAYELFQQGLRIHDELEKVYIAEMDFEKADALAEQLIDKILSGKPQNDREPYVFRRLFGTNTMDGIVNEVPALTAELTHVYHVKGRAGTGKSTFMKKVAAACFDDGYDLELYHCSFDPASIDMVLIPELKTCLFDSTDPHAFVPIDKNREEVIDLYETTVTPGTDEKYAAEITRLTKEYKAYMQKGLAVLQAEGEKLTSSASEQPIAKAEVTEIIRQIEMKLI